MRAAPSATTMLAARIAPTSRSMSPSSTALSSSAGQEACRCRATLRAMGVPPRTRKIGRLSEIAQVAVRHGFGYFFERHKLTDILPWTSRVELDSDAGSERGRHLRELLDELGPTFVKFGQLLSTRPDIVPPDIVVELRSLQDDVRPFPFEQARAVVEAELELSLEQAFLFFDESPIAAASIGQVHRATLPNGDPGRGQGAAAERATADRVRPGAALPGGADHQGARPLARLHRRERAGRRVRTLDQVRARLPARGAERRDVPAQLRGLRARAGAAGLPHLLRLARADARVPGRGPARRSRPGVALAGGAARARLPDHGDVDGDDLPARLLPRRPASGEHPRPRRRPDRRSSTSASSAS